MRIRVFGASGSTGKEVVKRALSLGHEAVAFARNPESIDLAHPRLMIRKGNVTDTTSIMLALESSNAAISCIGPRKNSSADSIVSTGTKNIVESCERTGVGRFVMQGGILNSADDLSFFNRIAVRVLRIIFSKAANDKAVAEHVVKSSHLAWVIVRPVGLADAPATGRYVAAPNARVQPFARLSFADCADSLIRAATESVWNRQTINLGSRE